MNCPRDTTAKAELAVIALGSNLPSAWGDSAQTVQTAALELQSLTDTPLRMSSLWRSTPLECPPGSPDFVNAVVIMQARAGESPLSLLHALQEIERTAGRQRSGLMNEPRALDLDLIDFGGRQLQSEVLVLPHPRACQRLFVVGPLAEIEPLWVLPGQSLSVEQLAAGLSESKAADTS